MGPKPFFSPDFRRPRRASSALGSRGGRLAGAWAPGAPGAGLRGGGGGVLLRGLRAAALGLGPGPPGRGPRGGGRRLGGGVVGGWGGGGSGWGLEGICWGLGLGGERLS